MTEIEKIMSETKEIAENIKANYTLEKTALQFGYKILIEKENRNCITLCDDFYYFDESVKEAEEKIDRYIKCIEVYAGELHQYGESLKRLFQRKLCIEILYLYGLQIKSRTRSGFYDNRKTNGRKWSA